MQFRVVALVPLAASSLVLLAVLSGPAIAGPDKEFGSAVKQNIEVQVVDMDPKYVGKLVEGGSGTRSSAAVRRYQTDRIRPLIQVDARTQVGSQGGASASTGGGN
jgi:hypothetical protein